MQSAELRRRHIQSFEKLTLSERLDWALGQHCFFAGFMGQEAKKLNKKIRRHGKKYFGD
jgi:hypothetical protein